MFQFIDGFISVIVSFNLFFCPKFYLLALLFDILSHDNKNHVVNIATTTTKHEPAKLFPMVSSDMCFKFRYIQALFRTILQVFMSFFFLSSFRCFFVLLSQLCLVLSRIEFLSTPAWEKKGSNPRIGKRIKSSPTWIWFVFFFFFQMCLQYSNAIVNLKKSKSAKTVVTHSFAQINKHSQKALRIFQMCKHLL